MVKKRVSCVVGLVLILLIVLAAGFLSKDNEILNDEEKKDNPVEIPEMSKEVELTVVGDFLYEEPYYASLRAGDDENKYFSKVQHYFQKSDLNIGNMEVVIGNDNLKTSGTGFSFCAPESVGKQVVNLGMDVLSTANNHSNDRGLDGRISTLEFFRENSDILTVGTYRDGERDVLKNVKEINGIKFGFLAYTYGTNVKIEESLRDGIGLFNDPDNVEHQKYVNKMSDEVKALRDNVDVLIVIMHWGAEFTYTPNGVQKNLANLLNSLGVDVIVGSHSHSIQPIEWINTLEHDTLVYYSLGNFVSADDDISRTGETFDNAYQFGLLSNLKVLKENDNIYIKDVKTEPIVNYYDKDMRNFMLVPFSEYDDTLESSHYRYKYNFNKSFIEGAYTSVIDEEFR